MKDLEIQVLKLKDFIEESDKEHNLIIQQMQAEKQHMQAELQKMSRLLADHGIAYTQTMPRIKHETSSSDSVSGSFRAPSSTSGTLSPPPSREYDKQKQRRLPEPEFDREQAGIGFVLAYDKHRSLPLPHHRS